jgi:hypothetical protein
LEFLLSLQSTKKHTILSTDFIIEKLIQDFTKRESFSRLELFDFFRQFEPNLKETTFRWRIHQLKTSKIIVSISKEHFTLSYKPTFKPEIGEVEKKIFAKIAKMFPALKLCIWSTKILSEFMLHIPAKSIIILQVEKNALEPIYDFLKKENIRNVYLQPDQKEIERYIFETESSVILQSLVSKAPTQKSDGIITATIEKIIVDLFSDKKLFSAFQGNELAHIVNNAKNRYSIDFTKIFSYAKRRRKEVEILKFLSEKTDISKSILND